MRHVRFLLAAIVVATMSLPAVAQPSVPFDDAGLHAVQFVDAREGWACGDDGTIWHTISGGQRWERQKTGTRASLRGLHFVNPYLGWAVGRTDAPNGTSVGVLLKSDGTNWQEVGSRVLPGLSAVRFFDEKNGVVCGDGTNAFPTGIFTTKDGGVTWEPVRGPRLPSCRSAAVLPRTFGMLAGGAWGRLGAVLLPQNDKGGVAAAEYTEGELDPLAGRSIHGVTCSTKVTEKGGAICFAAGDGGAVLTSSDGGKSWGYVDLKLPAAALASCDFHCVASFANHVWVAGRPGGFVLHSADLGKSWDVQKTPVGVPVNAIHFLDSKTGWLVGDLGCILGTTDGGTTWRVQKSGGQRAAILFLHAHGTRTPLDLVAAFGGADGYLCAATSLMNADPASASPNHAADDLRLRYAMRLAGGASGESGWAFPIAAHAAGLPPRDLLASWNRAHGGKANEQLLRQAVLAIRVWQPEVIVCDAYAATPPAPDALALNVAKEAFNQAADPKCFPEQIDTLNLRPWSPKKLYALAVNVPGAPVKLDQAAFNTRLNDTPKDYAERATRILAGEGASADRRELVLVAHRLQGSEKHTTLMEGVTLAAGGTARRATTTTYSDPSAATARQKAVQLRRSVEALAKFGDNELAGADKLMASLHSEVKKMPADVAARTAYAIGSRLVREGKWSEAREVFGVLAINYPGHPLSVEAFRWLARYHASTEARRRAEIQQKVLVKNAGFDGGGRIPINPAGGTNAHAGNPVVTQDEYKFHSPDMIFKWHAATLELEPKLAGFGPVYSRDPASWLCFLTARRQIGKYVEAEEFIARYFKHTPGAAAMTPGIDPWRDCLAAELWLTNREAVPMPPKAVATCKLTESRPLLDGKLDDTCWQAAKVMELKVITSASGKSEGAKLFGSQYKTTAMFSYDDRYLYLAVKCDHPAGKKVEPVAKRTRDANLAGHDRVDVLIDLDRDYQTYYRLQVDHRGCLAEDCWGDRTWNPKYHVAFHATETGWTAEYAIPLVELTGERPSHGKNWAVNVSRVVPGMGLQAWSGPADNEPRPEGMGLLQFRAEK